MQRGGENISKVEIRFLVNFFEDNFPFGVFIQLKKEKRREK
jgi:hypothetical protein